MTKNQKLLLIAVMLLVFAISKIALLAWWKNQQPQAQAAECQVTQGCTLPNGVYAKFSDPISSKQPFDITLKNVPEKVQKITVSFSMKNMDMGFNRYAIHRQSNGEWTATKIRLPMCVEGRRDYLADINIDGTVFQTAFTAE